MSSITKCELIAALENYPDDYEVIFEIHEKKDGKNITSLAYINGIRCEEFWHEIRLIN